MTIELIRNKTVYYSRIMEVTQEAFEALNSGEDIITNYLREKDMEDWDWNTSEVLVVEKEGGKDE